MDTSSPERFALDLDELMTDPVLLRKFRETNPAIPEFTLGFVDQLRAAAQDTRRVAQAGVAAGHYRGLARVPTRGIPEWVRLGTLTEFTTWVHGRGTTCMHSPTINRPEPVYASAWKPKLVTCIRCVFLHRHVKYSPLDRTCDCCGRVVAGMPDEPIFPSAMLLAGLTWQFGVCTDCLFWTPEKTGGQAG